MNTFNLKNDAPITILQMLESIKIHYLLLIYLFFFCIFTIYYDDPNIISSTYWMFSIPINDIN